VSPAAETLEFQAEVEQLLGLMVHSLYSHREVFLRELISNASDALDKLRLEALARPELAAAGERLAIRIEVEPAARILRVVDNGIGMSRQEVVENLGTVARSGTRRFLEALRAQGQAGGSELIGQFGVGFYASFMVAAEIVVETARAGETGGTRWRSDGKARFTVEDLPSAARGTRVELHLKPPEDDPAERDDFTDPARLRQLVRRWSDFVAWPIEMAAAHFEDDDDQKRVQAADGVEVVVLNSQRPLWSRPKDEITAEEHAAFYRHLAHASDEPLETIHFKGEGTSEYTALLYLPSERPLELFDPRAERSHVALYVRHVLVMADCEELLPPWLRFVRGVVDSQDLPLNVSREILQQNRALGQIRSRLVKKVLDALEALRDGRRDDYLKFWRGFGTVLKEGLVTDPARADAIAALLVCASSRGGEPTTLGECAGRLEKPDDPILCLAAPDAAAAERSPHLEAYKQRGREVLFFTDAVDEWVLERLREFQGRMVVRIDRGEVLPGGDAQREEIEEKERGERPLLESLEGHLSGRVDRVRFSGRLTESPAVLVDEEGSVGPHLAELMRQSGHEPPPRRRALELNPAHPLVERLARLAREDSGSKRLADSAELLLGQALLAEGSPLPDPARFGRLLNELLLSAV
jgi:molecular chaperone HtpG